LKIFLLQITPEQRKNMDFFIPEKGATMYIDSMVIPKGAKNIEMLIHL